MAANVALHKIPHNTGDKEHDMFSRRAFAGMIAAGLTEAAFAQRAKLSGVAPADTVWINGNEFPEGPPQASIDAMAQIIGTSNRYHYQEFPAFYEIGRASCRER